MRHFTVEVQRLEVSLDGLQTDDPRDILDNLPQFDTSAPTEAVCFILSFFCFDDGPHPTYKGSDVKACSTKE